jgi:triose/dihydroxyacetone kinase / FAD-AMP lyase (cyclizing)
VRWLTGDGDCGTTFKRGSEAVLTALHTSDVPVRGDLAQLLQWIAAVAGGAMGGTSGAILEILFTAAAVQSSKVNVYCYRAPEAINR